MSCIVLCGVESDGLEQSYLIPKTSYEETLAIAAQQFSIPRNEIVLAIRLDGRAGDVPAFARLIAGSFDLLANREMVYARSRRDGFTSPPASANSSRRNTVIEPSWEASSANRSSFAGVHSPLPRRASQPALSLGEGDYFGRRYSVGLPSPPITPDLGRPGSAPARRGSVVRFADEENTAAHLATSPPAYQSESALYLVHPPMAYGNYMPRRASSSTSMTTLLSHPPVRLSQAPPIWPQETLAGRKRSGSSAGNSVVDVPAPLSSSRRGDAVGRVDSPRPGPSSARYNYI